MSLASSNSISKSDGRPGPLDLRFRTPRWGTRLSDKNGYAHGPPYVYPDPGCTRDPGPPKPDYTRPPASESLARTVEINVVNDCHLPVQAPPKNGGRPGSLDLKVWVAPFGAPVCLTQIGVHAPPLPPPCISGSPVYPGPGSTQTRLHMARHRSHLHALWIKML